MLAALLLMQASPGAPVAAPAPAPTRPPACDSAEHAAFDFWVGEWDVYAAASGNHVARSSIQRLYNGCAIRENWMPLRGAGGGSLSNLDPESGRWHQTWIGSSPGRTEFVGGAVDGGMVLTGYWQNVNGPGQHALVRMTYTKREDGSVRQHGEASTDHGLTWRNSFDFIYKPRQPDGA
jgi:hypothetical protein